MLALSLSNPVSSVSSSVSEISFKHIKRNEKPLRRITTRKQRLARLNQTSLYNQLLQNSNDGSCKNCQASVEHLVLDNHSGTYVCTLCGACDQTPIYQELHPFLWGIGRNTSADALHSSEYGSDSSFESTYSRYFHFNEIMACFTLTGPWIPNSDYRCIKLYLTKANITVPNKCDIQRICKQINKDYGVKRFTQRYSEKWIQVKNRYCGEKPDFLDGQLVSDLRSEFRQMVRFWPYVKHLLKGNKNKSLRKQWPNYNETLYMLFKKRHRSHLYHAKKWISRLGAKKKEELKDFFNALFYLNGWI